MHKLIAEAYSKVNENTNVANLATAFLAA